MPNPNPSRAARLAASIDKAFGESFTFLPFTSSGDVNLPKIPDTSRAQFDARGAWDGPTKSATPHARGSVQDDNAHNWTASMPSVCIADAALNWTPKRGDRCLRQLDGAVYEISSTAPDGFGSTFFFLTARQ
ncbi:hypothetical protein [Bradyrhizobium sp. USDA 4350]